MNSDNGGTFSPNTTALNYYALACQELPDDFINCDNATNYIFGKFCFDDYMYITYVIYPILLICCTCGNVINLIIFAHEQPKGPTNIFLTVMAVCDLFVVWLYLPSYLFWVSRTLRCSKSFTTGFFNYRGMQEWGGQAAMECGDWTLVAFSLVRMLGVTMPLRFRWIQTKKTALFLVAFLLCLAGMFTLFYCVALYSMWIYPSMEKNLPRWLARWGDLQDETESVLPLVTLTALLIINSITIASLRRQQKSKVAVMRMNQQNAKGLRPTARNHSNILLTSSVVFYFVTQLPYVIFKSMTTLADDFNLLEVSAHTRNVMSPIVQMSLMVNYSLNFFLYITTSKRYRLQFVEIFRDTWCWKRVFDRASNCISRVPSGQSMSLSAASRNDAQFGEVELESLSVYSTTKIVTNGNTSRRRSVSCEQISMY